MVIKIISLVIASVIAVFIIGLISAVINFLGSLVTYFQAKSNKINYDLTKKSSGVPIMDLYDRNELTVSILNTINAIIDNEVARLFQSYAVLNKKYEVIRMDEDIKTLSSEVFKAIKPEIIKDPEIILTSDFVMQFIIQSISVKILDTAQQYNAALKSSN